MHRHAQVKRDREQLPGGAGKCGYGGVRCHVAEYRAGVQVRA